MFRWIYLSFIFCWAGCLGVIQTPAMAQVEASPSTPNVSPQTSKTITVKTGETLRIKVDLLRINQPIAVFLAWIIHEGLQKEESKKPET